MPLEQTGTAAVCPGDRRALYYLAAYFKPRALLELGTNVGGSTLSLTRALATFGPPDAHVVTVDILDVNNRADLSAAQHRTHESTPRQMLEQIGLADRVTFVQSDTVQFLSRNGKRFDFIFIDADHSAAAVYRDVASSLRALNPGGVIILHDYYPGNRPIYPSAKQVVPGTDVALSAIARESSVKPIPLGRLPWETKDGVNVTTLALLSS
jgi:predicted O-methyltransferase YrrM